MIHRDWSVSMTVITRMTTMTTATAGLVDFALHHPTRRHHGHPLLQGAVSRILSADPRSCRPAALYTPNGGGSDDASLPSPPLIATTRRRSKKERLLFATRSSHVCTVCIRVLTSSGTSF